MGTRDSGAGYSVHLLIQDWVYIDGSMDLASQSFARRSFDEGAWDPQDTRWGPLIEIADSVREDSRKQIPGIPTGDDDAQGWPPPDATADIRLSPTQWAMILAVFDTASAEGDEDAEALSLVASRIRASFTEAGVTDLPQVHIR
jgi:hypothetical protein